MASWRQVLTAVAEAWGQRADEIRGSGDRRSPSVWLEPRCSHRRRSPIQAGLLDEAERGLRAIYDPRYGGFGGAPKFPPASALEFLLRRGETEMTAATLHAMASGGMYDQVGGGFARYSVDARWLVPHFEKMLYDNALLARAYLHGWQVTGEPLFRRVCEETLEWAAARDARARGRLLLRPGRRLRGRGGPLLRLDARGAARGAGRRCPGRRRVLRRAARAGTSRVARSSPAAPSEPAGLDRIRERMYEARAERVWPGLDDKRLTVLERADDLRARRGRRGAGATPTSWTPRSACGEFVLRDLRDGRWPAAAHASRTARPSSTPTWRTTRSSSRRC